MKHVPTLTAMVIQPGESTPRVSSLQITEAFDKNHRDVLRKIKELLEECPSDFGERNFALSNYLDSQGKSKPKFLLTRDGFSLLAMSFTGQKATFWKIRYIEAFNDMEKALLPKRLLAVPEGRALIGQGLKLARRLTPERRQDIRRAVRYHAMGLCNTEIGLLLGCGRAKVRSLLLDHELSQGGMK